MLAALSASGPLHAQQDATSVLVEQGNYWQAQGRLRLAEQSWRKLLLVDPQSADAMYGMAQVEMSRGNAELADSWIARLRSAHPGDARIAPLQRQARQPGQGGTLQRARAAARAGRAAEAVELYRSQFDNRPPPESVALEFYQLLSSTPQGADEGRRGLEQLVKDHPDNPNYRLALAQLETYSEPTRREGIRGLVELSKQPAVGAAARASWRQALIWLDARAPDVPLYQDYLSRNPNDAAVAARLETLTGAQPAATPLPTVRPLDEGFRALDHGDPATAEQRFQQALRVQADDPDALGGLGLVRLRQERFAQAQKLLERASRGGNRKWASALRSATYWNLVGQARTAREENDLHAAQALLERAVRLDARERAGRLALADIRMLAGDLARAEEDYKRMLENKPGDGQALRGLVTVYGRQGRSDEALALLRQLTPEQLAQVAGLRDAQVEQARARAAAQTRAGDQAGARRTLEDAMRAAPDSPWVRLDLADLYRRGGLVAEARGVMEGLLMAQPDGPDALFASALFAAESGDPAAGIQYLERIPAASITRDMAALQRRLRAQSQARRALLLARQGQVDAARWLLGQTEAALSADMPAELWGQLAGAYAEIGDVPRALALGRQLLAHSPDPGAGDRLLYASVLLQTGQEAELSEMLRQLQTADMTASQHRDFDSLRAAFSLRRTDALREAGKLDAAGDAIAPVLAERPDDPQVMAALARLYSARRDERQALALYRRILQRSPADLDSLLAAAASASALREHGEAENYALAALKQAPDRSRVLATAGRVYRHAGDSARAEQYLRAAVAAESRSTADPLVSELQALEAQRAMTLSAGTVYRHRAGEAGLSQLSDVQLPIQARIPVGEGKVVVGVTPTVLDAGTVKSDDPATSRFGGGPAPAFSQFTNPPGRQYASGVGLSIGYEDKDFNANIGTTPLGFPQTRVIGNVSLSGQLGASVSYKADLSRRAVTDSLLSFAGARDPRTGDRWGGVVATGARGDIGYDDGSAGFYGYGSVHGITGRNVANNTRVELGGGAYLHLLDSAGSKLTIGLNLGLMGYDRNLSDYTFGQGGYFSPQRFASVAVPLDWSGHSDRLSWRLNAALGFQSFTQRASPYFPTDPARQNEAARAAANAMVLGLGSAAFTGSYPGASKTGLAYNLAAVIEYQLAPKTYLGISVGLNNAQNYRQFTGGAYLRYVFDGSGSLGAPSGGPGGTTLSPVVSPYTPLL